MTVFAHFLFKCKMTLNSSFKIRWEVLFKKMHLFLLVMIAICCSFIFFIWTVMDWLLGRWHLFQPQQPTRKKEEWVKFEPTDHKIFGLDLHSPHSLQALYSLWDRHLILPTPNLTLQKLRAGMISLGMFWISPSFNKQTAKVSCKPYLTDIANCSFVLRQIGSLTERALLLWFSPIMTKKIQQ